MEGGDWIKEVSDEIYCSETNGAVLEGWMAPFVKAIGIVGIVACFPAFAKKRNYCR